MTGLTLKDSLYLGIDKDNQRCLISLQSSNENVLRCAADFMFDSWGAFNFTTGAVLNSPDQGSLGVYLNSYKQKVGFLIWVNS